MLCLLNFLLNTVHSAELLGSSCPKREVGFNLFFSSFFLYYTFLMEKKEPDIMISREFVTVFLRHEFVHRKL